MTQTAAAAEESTPHLFTVEEYLALDIPGRTELIEGVIYGPPTRIFAETERFEVRGVPIAATLLFEPAA